MQEATQGGTRVAVRFGMIVSKTESDHELRMKKCRKYTLCKDQEKMESASSAAFFLFFRL